MPHERFFPSLTASTTETLIFPPLVAESAVLFFSNPCVMGHSPLCRPHRPPFFCPSVKDWFLEVGPFPPKAFALTSFLPHLVYYLSPTPSLTPEIPLCVEKDAVPLSVHFEPSCTGAGLISWFLVSFFYENSIFPTSLLPVSASCTHTQGCSVSSPLGYFKETGSPLFDRRGMKPVSFS